MSFPQQESGSKFHYTQMYMYWILYIVLQERKPSPEKGESQKKHIPTIKEPSQSSANQIRIVPSVPRALRKRSGAQEVTPEVLTSPAQQPKIDRFKIIPPKPKSSPRTRELKAGSETFWSETAGSRGTGNGNGLGGDSSDDRSESGFGWREWSSKIPILSKKMIKRYLLVVLLLLYFLQQNCHRFIHIRWFQCWSNYSHPWVTQKLAFVSANVFPIWIEDHSLIPPSSDANTTVQTSEFKSTCPSG